MYPVLFRSAVELVRVNPRVASVLIGVLLYVRLPRRAGTGV
ncbi:MAG TPA: hypothetical protein VN812_11980 [Candidatus Acidoferrales bacterium]|nr:hypothetical protein [Candidatus Acidoferrales bacterium]